MLKFADKTFVSYPGGAGGDMFAASMNGISIAAEQHFAVKHTPFSIKHLEKLIETNKITLEFAAHNVEFKYITTHLVNELPSNSLLLIFNDQTLNTIVCRQMQLQRLTLELNSGTFSTIVQSLCLKQQWDRAATIWFNFALERAQKINKTRLESRLPKIDFSHVLSNEFADSLVVQGWQDQIELLRENHSVWLKKQPVFSKEDSIKIMASKLKEMNWGNSSGSVVYDCKN